MARGTKTSRDFVARSSASRPTNNALLAKTFSLGILVSSTCGKSNEQVYLQMTLHAITIKNLQRVAGIKTVIKFAFDETLTLIIHQRNR